MPNVKLFVDSGLWEDRKRDLLGCADALRDLLCGELSVPVDACQIAFIPCFGPSGQPTVNVEIALMRAAGRTPQKIEHVASKIRLMIEAASGDRTAVRCTQLDHESYFKLK
ncbi:hypothetical protein LCL97_15540 [Seohaeicola saemankumensis]|nr:hypothetical protein [Seohaeicola saemankumensis]MCA0872248.1 hypothetical protein [Seohaeicola saemankumensis]